MYKSKLQELCHKNGWALPKYSGMKDGPDHNPQFKASVVVSGANFDTINICKSLKEAYNEAAKLAFFHFSSDGELTRGGTNVEHAVKAVGMDSPVRTVQDDCESTRGGRKVEQAVTGVGINANASSIQDDLQQKFKTKLQIYVQRKNLGLPLYRGTREGPPNSLRFRTTVTVGGDSFESPGSYNNIKQAEDAAAQVALMALSTDAFQENDISLYKNLLQEFARSEGFFMPQYKTTRIGEAHDMTFYATVEVEGETFHGNPAKSKKQAELNAAKVAYTAFMQCKSRRTGDFLSSFSKDEVFKLAPRLNELNLPDMRSNHKSESQTSSTSSARHEAPAEVSKDEDEETVFSENVRAKTRFKMASISVPLDTGKCFQTDEFSSSSSVDEVLKLTPRTSSHSIINLRGNPKSICPTVSTTAKYEAQNQGSKDEDEETVFNKNILAKAKFETKENISVASYKDSSTMKMPTEIKSYLLNNRIRVYTYFPDVASPEGNVVLPIAEGKWVVMSLEFPK